MTRYSVPEKILTDATRSAREWRRWRGMAASAAVIGAWFIVGSIAMLTEDLGAGFVFLGLFLVSGILMAAGGARAYRRLGRIKPEGP